MPSTPRRAGLLGASQRGQQSPRAPRLHARQPRRAPGGTTRRCAPTRAATSRRQRTSQATRTSWRKRSSNCAGVCTPAAVRPIRYKLARWAELARAAGRRDPWAFTEQIVTDVMAALVKAQFRSADGYLNAAKQAFVSSGGQVSDALRLLCRILTRAPRRGQGPPRQSTGLPLERCGVLPSGPAPWAQRGPTHPGQPSFSARGGC